MKIFLKTGATMATTGLVTIQENKLDILIGCILYLGFALGVFIPLVKQLAWQIVPAHSLWY